MQKCDCVAQRYNGIRDLLTFVISKVGKNVETDHNFIHSITSGSTWDEQILARKQDNILRLKVSGNVELLLFYAR